MKSLDFFWMKNIGRDESSTPDSDLGNHDVGVDVNVLCFFSMMAGTQHW